MSQTKCLAFVDTNVFLHFRPVEEVDWKYVLESNSDIVIAIAPVVVRELDQQKDSNGRGTIRQRARAALKWIEEAAQLETETDFGLRVLVSPEPSLTFTEFGLNPIVNDDHLIACCIEAKSSQPMSKVVVISDDTGPRLKARQFGFQAMGLAEQYRLPSAADEAEREKRELERELQRLRTRLPRLELAFRDGNAHQPVEVSSPVLDPARKESLIAEARTLFPYMGRPRAATRGYIEGSLVASLASTSAPLGPSRVAIKHYDENLTRFFERLKEYLDALETWENLRRRTVEIEVALFNRGTAPAQDIDVFLTFPSWVKVYLENSFPAQPERPEPPERPRSSFGTRDYLFDAIRQLSRQEVESSWSDGSPRVTTLDSGEHQIEFRIPSLKHLLSEKCDPVLVVFESFESAKGFSIEYRMIAADLPDELRGHLNVSVNKVTSHESGD